MKLVFATSNNHKVKEAAFTLAPYGIQVLAKPMKGVEIQDDDVGEVARFSASFVPQNQNPFFVEDTGLYVNSLRGFPGPFSAYVFRTIGNEGLLKLLGEDRTAYFESAVALRIRDVVKVFKGRIDGRISYNVRGDKGFGFDPVFIPEGMEKTLGEMELEEKCSISHRARALRMMAEWLKENSEL
ncbi:MAG: XTP/dITP diphosphatase [Conexivisphaerales archaeon]